MTQEKFRLWMVILLALSLLTVWVGMGMKLYKWDKYKTMQHKGGMTMPQMPQRMPNR